MVPEPARGKGDKQGLLTGAQQTGAAPCYRFAMRKMCCSRTHFLAGYSVWLAALSLVSFSVFAQEQTPALPDDAKELMLLEAKSNGLAGTDFHPWHLKFTYQVFDSEGTVSGAGTVEEFWASRARSKKVISSGAFSQASFLTENGVVISGDKGQSPWEASTLLFDFANPLPGTRQITSNDFANMPAQFGVGDMLSPTPMFFRRFAIPP